MRSIKSSCIVVGIWMLLGIGMAHAESNQTDAGSTKSGNVLQKQQDVPSSVKFNLNLSLGSWVTDRAFQTSTQAVDGIFDGSLNLSLTGYSWGLFYQGGWSAYMANNTLTRHAHKLTGEKRFALPFLHGVLAMGGSFVWDDYASFYENYDRIRPEAYTGMKLYAGRNVMLQALSTLGYAHYLNRSMYSHLYHTLSLQGTTWFSTRTTVRLQMDWTLKHFTSNENTSSSLSLNPDVTGSNRLQIYLRVAQSLNRTMALRLWGSYIPNVNSSYRFSDLQEGNQVQNVSDDLNAVHGGSAGAEWEYRPVKSLRLVLSGTWSLNHYGGFIARDSSGNTLSSNAEREDMVGDFGAQIAWRMPFQISGFWGSGIYLKASYLFRINASNDANYNYTQHLAYLGLSTSW